MTESDRIKYLRVAVLIVGLIFTFGIWPLTIGSVIDSIGVDTALRDYSCLVRTDYLRLLATPFESAALA